MKLRKQSANKRTIIYLLLIIFLLTYTILSTIGKKSSDNIIEVSNTLINDLIIDIVNSSIKNDILKRIPVYTDNLLHISIPAGCWKYPAYFQY